MYGQFVAICFEESGGVALLEFMQKDKRDFFWISSILAMVSFIVCVAADPEFRWWFCGVGAFSAACAVVAIISFKSGKEKNL